MLSWRDNLTPPVRAEMLAEEQGRKGKPPVVLDERQLRMWARLRLLNVSESDVATLLGCTVPQFRRLMRQEPWKTIWNRGPVETKVAIVQRQLALSQLNRPDQVVKETGLDGKVTEKTIKGGPHPGSGDMAKWLGKQYLGQAEREMIPPVPPGGRMAIQRVEWIVVDAPRNSDDTEEPKETGEPVETREPVARGEPRMVGEPDTQGESSAQGEPGLRGEPSQKGANGTRRLTIEHEVIE